MERVNFSDWKVIERVGNKVLITPKEKTINTVFLIPFPINDVSIKDVETIIGVQDIANYFDIIKWFNLVT